MSLIFLALFYKLAKQPRILIALQNFVTLIVNFKSSIQGRWLIVLGWLMDFIILITSSSKVDKLKL